MQVTLSKVGWGFMTLLCATMVLTMLRYFGGDPAAYFQPEVYIDRIVALRIHIAGGIVAALVGPAQFLPAIRNKYRSAHRTLGKVYIVSVLVSAIFALLIATTALGGLVTQIGFSLMAFAWAITTLLAYSNIRAKKVEAHRRWMIRSFAVTFGFVMLRIIFPTLQFGVGFDEVTAFQITAYACWIPNLLIVEYALRSNTRQMA